MLSTMSLRVLMEYLAIFMVLGMFQVSNGQQQIFFPREAKIVEPPCVAYDGSQGYCRLLVKCATFFAEIAQLSRSPCPISEEQKGVCCPPTKKQTRDPSTLVPKGTPTIPNQPIVFPDVTIEELNQACQQSISSFADREKFTQDLVDRNIIAPPGSPEFLHARLFETRDEIFKKSQDAAIVLGATVNMKETFNLDKVQAETGIPMFTVKETIIKDTCPPVPPCPDPKYSYRTMDGSCNNILHKDWGKAGVAFTRMIPSVYEDGISTIRLATNKLPLPSARLVSATMAPPGSDKYNNLTNLVWQWGQFLDHDITHTPISKGANKSDISCCKRGQLREPGDTHPECFPIDIPEDDKFYAQFSQRCMEFVRSMAAIRPECKFGPREQMNQITSYIDGSNVYGSTEQEAMALRAFKGGALKVTMQGTRELLPGNHENVGCVSKSEEEKCFSAGDTRVNEQPDLAVMHTVWVRQHNKIARELEKINPSWTDEILFQEARRIVAAQMQHITYNEYLPIVLGREFMETYGLLPKTEGYFRGYRSDVDATITNAFAAAAFRYGHTLITDSLQGFGKFGNLKHEMELSKTQFLPFALYQPDTLDSLMRGLTLQQSQRFDRFFSDQLTNKLFAQNRAFGMDLVALNIQRARDHGLPPYTKWREACNLVPFNSWEDAMSEMDPSVVFHLQSVYPSVHDVDLFVGGVSEKTAGGSLLGSTFLCIVGREFTKLKLGDRFYYENGEARERNFPGDSGEPLSSFLDSQLNEIRKTSLARIFCDNADSMEMMQPLAFVTAHLANKRAVCDSHVLIPRMSLDPWKNARVWVK